MDGGNAFEGTKSGHPAAMNLGEGLGGCDADPGSVVASRAGSCDDGGELFAGRKVGQDLLQGGEEIAFLGALTGKVLERLTMAIATEGEGRVRDAGFDGEDPFVGHIGSLDGQFILSN